jgi:hypothetical protein
VAFAKTANSKASHTRNKTAHTRRNQRSPATRARHEDPGVLAPQKRQQKNKMEIKKESPDVETPGLLVKALISSFFMSKAVSTADLLLV